MLLLNIHAGVGYCAVLVAFYVSFYYTVIIAWAFYFLFASLQSTLPWTRCDGPWNTPQCSMPKCQTSRSSPPPSDSAAFSSSGTSNASNDSAAAYAALLRQSSQAQSRQSFSSYFSFFSSGLQGDDPLSSIGDDLEGSGSAVLDAVSSVVFGPANSVLDSSTAAGGDIFMGQGSGSGAGAVEEHAPSSPAFEYFS
jgi:hypothetical protein